jgi:DNA-binding transcriptional MocR family regulator
MLRLPPGVDEDRIIAAAAAKGLALQGTRAMYGSLPAEDGVIVSYARAPRSVLADAVRRLADAAHLIDTTAPPPDAESLRVVAPAATALDYF